MGTTRTLLSLVYRLSAVRQISGFRTVSDEAVLVLTKTIPIDILADIIVGLLCLLRRVEFQNSMERIQPENG